jgi:hypothetical protein
MLARMKLHAVGFAVLLSVVAMPGRAEAKGIPLIYNTGQESFATGPLPPPLDTVKELEGFQAGYLCDIKGIMWSYFSVSNCKPVAFKGDTYTDEPEVVKAVTAKYTEADMQRGLWGRFGWMGLAGVVAVGALLWVKEKVTKS